MARVTALRRAEQAAMLEYAKTGECRMAFLRRQLDDASATRCGRCDNCTGDRVRVALDTERVQAAITYLRDATLVLEPRRRWPVGLGEPRGAIPTGLQLQPGRVLGVYGDGGWGSVVRQAKDAAHRLPDGLVDAAARLISRTWRPDPPPAWLACVPSSTFPELVPDFAQRLARTLGLEFRDVVRRVRPGRPQKEMENSAQQLRNVYGAFQVVNPPPAGAVLLVDDIVDSRWTLTVVGAALREAGSGEVHPFVLAKAVSA